MFARTPIRSGDLSCGYDPIVYVRATSWWFDGRICMVRAESWTGAGLWFAPVEHEGNQSSSPEEVERVVRIVDSLVPGAFWIDCENRRRALSL